MLRKWEAGIVRQDINEMRYVDYILEKSKSGKVTMKEINLAWQALDDEVKILKSMNVRLVGTLERPDGPLARHKTGGVI